MRQLAIVVPAYNEADHVATVLNGFEEIRSACKALAFEPFLVLVDDGSADATNDVFVAALKKRRLPAKVIRLSRNFGKDSAILAALQETVADAYAIIDADGQTPFGLLPDMIRKLQSGPYELIHAVKRGESYGPVRRLLTWLFFLVARLLRIKELRKGISDFMLFTRPARDRLLLLSEKELVVRNLIHWLGLPKESVPFKPAKSRRSSFTFRKLFVLAMKSFISFSSILRINFVIALCYWVFSLFYGTLIIYNKITGRIVVGLSTMTLLTLFSFGLMFFMIAIIGEYLIVIFEEVKKRPRYLIDRVVDINLATPRQRQRRQRSSISRSRSG